MVMAESRFKTLDNSFFWLNFNTSIRINFSFDTGRQKKNFWYRPLGGQKRKNEKKIFLCSFND